MSRHNLKVLVVGDVLVDLLCFLDRIPLPGEERHCTNSTLRVGGAAYNTAYTLANLGLETYLYAALGDDHLGRLCLSSIRSAKINTAYVELTSHPTGYCVSIIPESGERAMVTYRGASAHLSLNRIPQISRGFNAIHVSGYVVDSHNKLDELRSALAEVKRGKRPPTIFFDPGLTLHTLTDMWYERLSGLIDHVMLNEHELRGTGLSPEELFEAVKAETLTVKLGGRGALLIWGGGGFKAEPPEELKIRDSIGAGDAFNAYYMAFILSGDRPDTALARAVGAVHSSLKDRR